MPINKFYPSLLLVLFAISSLAQNKPSSTEELNENIKAVELKIDSVGWSEEDKTQFQEIKLLIYNEKTGDVYEKMKTYDISFVKKLNEVVEIADLYAWDNSFHWLNEREKMGKRLTFDTAIPDPNKIDSVRAAFLNKVKERYPFGITEETVEGGGNYIIYRTVFNSKEETIIYEKKVWKWGGEFYFKDGDMAINKDDYEMGLEMNKKKFEELEKHIEK